MKAEADRARAEAERNKPAAQPTPQPPPSTAGLGDAVANALDAVGITKDRVAKWLGEPCNCHERQEKLNRLGQWAAGVASATAATAKEALQKLIG